MRSNQFAEGTYSYESEIVVLGFGVCSPQTAHQFCETVHPKMFWFPDHQLIATAILTMHREGWPIDTVTAKNFMASRGLMAEKPGPNQVTVETFFDICANAFSMGGVFESNARRVKDLWRLRMIRERALEVAEEVLNPERTLDWKLEAAATITAGLFAADAGEAVTAETVDLSPRQGISLGMGPVLDEATGGAHGGQLNTVQGGTKAGKSTTMIQMARHALWQGETVIYVPIADLTPGDLARRIIRQVCGWDKPPYIMAESAAYHETVKNFRGLKDQLTIYDPNQSGKTTDIEDVTAWLSAQIHKKRPHRIFLDYFQRFTTRQTREVGAGLYAVVADKLGKWCHQYPDILTFVGSQETDDGRTRWSRELENETALKLRVVKPEGDESRRVISVDLNRFGPMGTQVGYDFDKKYLILREDEP